jgi:ABC-2 type transport system ATP-binding protein
VGEDSSGGDRQLSAVIELDHASRWYGDVIGINDVSLAFGPGVTGLLGPNGAGKSTLMRLITGQLQASQGTVRVFGEPVWSNQALFRRIGFCPDQDAFYETMSGLEFVRTLAMLSGMSRREAQSKAEHALDTVKLAPEAWKRKIGGYSKGMRQRAKLAQALVHDPELLILDEPLTGLDPVGRREVLELVRALASGGRTVIVSSHILHEVEAITHEIVIIHHGRVLASGDIAQIRELIDEHPHHVSIHCSDPRTLGSALLEADDVVSVAMGTEPGAIVVETAKPDAFYGRVADVVLAKGITVKRLTSLDDNLQAVFGYLVK